MDVGCGKFCPTDLTDFTDDHLIKSMLDGKFSEHLLPQLFYHECTNIFFKIIVNNS